MQCAILQLVIDYINSTVYIVYAFLEVFDEKNKTMKHF